MRRVLLALSLVMFAGSALGDIIVIDNGLAPPNPENVIDADNSFPDDSVYVINVGWDETGDPTSVEVAEGGVVGGDFLWVFRSSSVVLSGGSVQSELFAVDRSNVVMSGGSLSFNLYAFDSSTITMSGGVLGRDLTAAGSSTVTISSGEVTKALEATYSSTVTMSGGKVGYVWTSGSPIFTLSGGELIGNFEANDDSRVTVSGGSILGGDLVASGYSTVTMTGGTLSYDLLATGSSTVKMSGGSVDGGLWASSSSVLALSGGTVGRYLYAKGSSVITMSGGSVGSQIAAYDSANIRIVGTGFAVDGVPVGYGPIAAPTGRLTGTLESGEALDNQFCHKGTDDCSPAIYADGLISLGLPGDLVEVGDPGNPPDDAQNCCSADCGSVPYTFYISRHEVTNSQYAEFLNAKAAADPLRLYNLAMGLNAEGGITRSGTSGGYTYLVKPGFEQRPVNFVSFYDAVRFANWLHNDRGDGDTETGAYTLLGGTDVPSNGSTMTRNPGALVFLPTESEWYKAAYYDGLSARYLDYPAGSDAEPTCATPSATTNTANCGEVVGGLTDVGAYAGSTSPYGTFDQGGNISEWNETRCGSERGVRGGSWRSDADILAATNGGAYNPPSELADFGFRVATLIPEPDATVLALIVLAGLAARQERRKRNL